MYENVPKGYQLQIHTWENDGDSWTTQTLSGLTKVDVLFYLHILKPFQKDGTLGNSFVPVYDLVDIVNKTLQEFLPNRPNMSQDILDRWGDAIQLDDRNGSPYIYELLCEELLGYPNDQYYNDEPNFCRVFDRFEVFYIPVFYIPEVLLNVTEEFARLAK